MNKLQRIKKRNKNIIALLHILCFFMLILSVFILYLSIGTEHYTLQKKREAIFASSFGIVFSIFISCIFSNLHKHIFNSATNFLKSVFVFEKNKTENPPFSLLLKIADLLPKKQRKSLIQEVSDMRLEYYEALSEKKTWRAKCIVAFYYIGLSWSVVMWISDKVKEVVGIIPKKN
jgi:hypothetical protein